MTADTLELRYVPLETLRRWDRNVKKHDMGALVASIERHGFRDPPAFDASLNGGEGGVVEGNGRGEALTLIRAEGRPAPRGVVVEGADWLVPVIFGLDAPSQAAAEAYGVAHNNLTLAGGDFTALDIAGLWEPAGYAALLEDLAQQGEIPVGLDGDDVDALLRELAGVDPGQGGDEFDATPDEGPTRAQIGDLWLIDGGRHRLIVGDSTDPATVARLMDGERADMFWSDPPYNVDYEGGTDQALKIQNDSMSADEFRAFLGQAFTAADAAMREGAVYYIAHSDVYAYEFIGATRDVGWQAARPAAVQWVKDTMVLGRGDYHSQSEPMLYGWKPGAAHHAVTDRTQTNTWFIDRPKTSEDHPTMKPVELVERALRNSSNTGALVLDSFLGSGTTPIAAHRTGRRCYGVEIEPRYADVILRRAEAEGLTVERAP
jgi:DNA modification methylase